MVALMTCSFATAQQSAKETIKERKQIAKLAQSELNARASKTARKEAKVLAKEGWIVAPGQLPLEKQLDKAYSIYYEYEESGLPKYIIGEAISIGKTYDAAKMQALTLARESLASMIQTEVTALVESTVANEQLAQEDAESLVRTIQASKDLIVQRLGRTVPVMECYRTLANKNVQVNVRIAYNSKMALESAKNIVKEELESQGEKLHNELDQMWEQIGE